VKQFFISFGQNKALTLYFNSPQTNLQQIYHVLKILAYQTTA